MAAKVVSEVSYAAEDANARMRAAPERLAEQEACIATLIDLCSLGAPAVEAIVGARVISCTIRALQRAHTAQISVESSGSVPPRLPASALGLLRRLSMCSRGAHAVCDEGGIPAALQWCDAQRVDQGGAAAAALSLLITVFDELNSAAPMIIAAHAVPVALACARCHAAVVARASADNTVADTQLQAKEVLVEPSTTSTSRVVIERALLLLWSLSEAEEAGRMWVPARAASDLALGTLAWPDAHAGWAAALGLLATVARSRDGAEVLLDGDACLDAVGAALRRSRVEQLEVYEPALALLWTLARSEVPSAEARVTEAAVADGMPPSLAPLLGEASQEDALRRLRQLRGDELLHGLLGQTALCDAGALMGSLQ